jgi:Domain of unknown function (DUF4383)
MTTPFQIDRLTSHQDQPSAGQLTAVVVGSLYLVVGLFGFMVTGSSTFAGSDPAHNIAGLTVNPLQNVLHLLIGGLGIGAYVGPGVARLYGVGLFLFCGALCVIGLIAGVPNFLNADQGTNAVHGITAVLGALIAVLPVGRNRADSAQGER